MPTYNISTELFQTHLNNVEVIGVNTIIPLAIIFFCIIVITRDYKRWAGLALPVSIALSIAGVKIPILMGLAAAVLFVTDLGNQEVIGRVIKGTYNTTAKTISSLPLGVKLGQRKLKKELAIETAGLEKGRKLTKKQLEKKLQQFSEYRKLGLTNKEAMQRALLKTKSFLDTKEKLGTVKKETTIRERMKLKTSKELAKQSEQRTKQNTALTLLSSKFNDVRKRLDYVTNLLKSDEYGDYTLMNHRTRKSMEKEQTELKELHDTLMTRISSLTKKRGE